MMGYPNADMKENFKHTFGDNSCDTLKDVTAQGLESVNNTAQALIAISMEKLELAKKSGDIDDIKKAISSLQEIVGTVGSESKLGVSTFKQAVEAEKKATNEVLDTTQTIESALHKGDKFTNEAVEYFNKSKNHLGNAADAVSKSEDFDEALERVDPGTPTQERRRGFWRGVAATALGIEAMIERVTSFPTRMRIKAAQNINNRIDAVNEVADSFANRITNEFNDLRDGVLSVVDGVTGKIRDTKNSVIDRKNAIVGSVALAVDGIRAVGDTMADTMDQSIDFAVNNTYAPIKNFITNKAMPALKSIGRSALDTVYASGEGMRVNFKENLQRRQEIRASANLQPVHNKKEETSNKM